MGRIMSGRIQWGSIKANDYIHAQSRNPKYFSSGGSTIRGTGGTPFMRYLRKHRDETRESIKN